MLLDKIGLTIYNPRNEEPSELIDNFVIRTKEYNIIIDDIRNSEMKYPEQNYIIQGQRGYGKTTLLLRLYYEILEDKVLNNKIFPIIFTEEQYNIRSLAKLWEHIADYLEEDDNFNGIYNDLKLLNKQDDYESKCFNTLESYLKKNNKKLILFIDNIGNMFDRFSEKENHRLREILLTSPEIRIIGGSSEILEHTYNYSKPFFDFFQIIDLKGLNQQQTETLLLKLSEKFGIEEKEYVQNILNTHPGRVESLRRLTGGVPRTIVLLFEVFIDNKNGNSFQDLELILDRVTPLYKHRMDDLSVNQQAIVDVIAMNWDAINTKLISEETGMESKIVSAQLRELEKNRIIEKIQTSTKNHLYQISERFFNIWYLMRYGRKKDKNKVRWLVQFLEIWCDKEELNNRVIKHIVALKAGKIYDKHALYMSRALSETGINWELQYDLITSTKDYLKIKNSHLLSALSTSYLKLNEQLLHEIKKGNSDAMFFLGTLYSEEYKDIEKAEKYFLMAAEKGDSDAMNCLAVLYYEEYKNIEKAEKYFLMAIKRGNSDAMNNLSALYFNEYKDKESEKYFLMAVEKGNFDNVYEFCSLLLIKNRSDDSINILKRVFYNENYIHDYENKEFIDLIILLISKKQYNFVYKLFNENKFHLKDKIKPIYYSLMYFLQDKYPDEYKKMGSELKDTVEEIISKINQLAIDYA